MTPPAQPRSSKLMRPLYFGAGIVLVGVGIAGYILPILPGTIWLILAAWCFARSSPRFEAWLLNHPRFGPSVVAWRQYGAIPRRVKIIAIAMMALSFVIIVLSHPAAWLLWLTGAILIACAVFVSTRPEGPKIKES
jgi:uncharacterized protein